MIDYDDDEWPNLGHDPRCMLYLNDYCCEDCYKCTCLDLEKEHSVIWSEEINGD